MPEAHAWMISSGEYSDYVVWCIFENETDAHAYARHVNARSMLRKHRDNVESDYTPPNAQWKCVDPIDECPRHGDVWAEVVRNGGNWTCRVEQVQWHPDGDRPFRTFKYVSEALSRSANA
jgi:hypothetical protein